MGLKTTKGCCYETGNGCCVPEICWSGTYTFNTNNAGGQVAGSYSAPLTLSPLGIRHPDFEPARRSCIYWHNPSFTEYFSCTGAPGTWTQEWGTQIDFQIDIGNDVARVDWQEPVGTDVCWPNGYQIGCRADYRIAPEHVFGTRCSETLTLTLDDYYKIGWVQGHGDTQDCTAPPSTVTLTPAPGCPSAVITTCPICATFTITDEVEDDGCGDCTAFSTTVRLYRAIGTGTCTLASDAVTTCGSYFGGSYTRWVLSYDINTSAWDLALIVLNGAMDDIGAAVTYQLTGSTDTILPKTLTFVADATGCTTWPATIEIKACVGDPIYGACCQTGGSTGISICGEADRFTCNLVGGDFLGENTNCYIDGCAGCDYPSACIVTSNLYPTIDVTVTGATGPCGANETQTMAHTTGCTWFYDGGSAISYTLQLIDATPPSLPTWRVTIEAQKGGPSNSTIVFEYQASCLLPEIQLAFISESYEVACAGTAYNAATVQLSF